MRIRLGSIISVVSARQVLVLMAYAYMLICYPFTFNFEIEINDHYFLWAYATLVCAVNILVEIIRGGKESIINNMLVLFSLVIFLVLKQVGTGIQSNEHFCVFLSIVVLLAPVIGAGEKFIDGLLIGIMLFYLFELAIGLYQIIGQPGNTISTARGTLKNSGIYAIYIIIHLPLVWYWLQKQLLWGRIIFLLFVVLTVIIVCINRSRTAVLALIVITAVAAFRKRKEAFLTGNRWFVWPVVAFSMSAIVLLFTWLLSIKQLSVSGRWLGLAVARAHVSDHLWWGIGFGRFSWYYPQWQQTFFLNPSGFIPSSFYASAGESYLVFNEFIVLAKEVGIIGFTGFLIALVKFFTLRSAANAPLLYIMKLVAITILGCAFTSYPFHAGPVLFLFVFCLFSGYALSDKVPMFNYVTLIKVQKVCNITNALLCVCVLIFTLQMAFAICKWQALRNDVSTGETEKIESYKNLLPYLHNDGKFLTDYAEVLLQDTAYCDEACNMLEKSKKQFVSYRNYKDAAKAFECAGNIKKAIENYKFLSYYIPQRFSPKFEMARLYLKERDTLNAKNIARYILRMKVKKASEEADRIKTEAKQIIELSNKKQ